MNRSAQRVAAWVSQGLGALRPGFRPGLRILMYHSVGGTVPGDRYGLSVSPEWFAEQMRWLREESGLTPISLAEGCRILSDSTPAGTTVVVSFDDGFRDVLTTAAPVLVRHRLPFTVFVVGAYLASPPTRGVYLDRAGLRELAAIPGTLIGAHGHTHRPLIRLGDATVAEELGRSAAAVADVIGVRPAMMSYPHGAVDNRIERLAAAAGFVGGATSLFGINRPGVPLLRLRRTEIAAGDSLATFVGKVRGDWDWYQFKQRLYWPVPAA